MEKEAPTFRQELKDLASTDPDVAELLQQLEASLRDEEFQDEDIVITGVEATLDGIYCRSPPPFSFVWLRTARSSLRAQRNTNSQTTLGLN